MIRFSSGHCMETDPDIQIGADSLHIRHHFLWLLKHRMKSQSVSVFNLMYFLIWPGPGVHRELWLVFRSLGSTVWLWDHMMKKPGVHWPEGGNWWSRFSLCGLQSVASEVSIVCNLVKKRGFFLNYFWNSFKIVFLWNTFTLDVLTLTLMLKWGLLAVSGSLAKVVPFQYRNTPHALSDHLSFSVNYRLEGMQSVVQGNTQYKHLHTF